MTGSIICGVDDSESAKGAARVARELGARLGLPLTFVRVLEAGASEKRMNAAAERLQHLTEAATELDCGAGWLVEAGGSAAERLVAAASAEEASLIVVGSQGARSSILSNVSADVSRRAPCPVVVVPPGAGGATSNGNHHIHQDDRFAGGIARLGLGWSKGGEESDLAGGIVRFTFGSGAN